MKMIAIFMKYDQTPPFVSFWTSPALSLFQRTYSKPAAVLYRMAHPAVRSRGQAGQCQCKMYQGILSLSLKPLMSRMHFSYQAKLSQEKNLTIFNRKIKLDYVYNIEVL